MQQSKKKLHLQLMYIVQSLLTLTKKRRQSENLHLSKGKHKGRKKTKHKKIQE